MASYGIDDRIGCTEYGIDFFDGGNKRKCRGDDIFFSGCELFWFFAFQDPIAVQLIFNINIYGVLVFSK